MNEPVQFRCARSSDVEELKAFQISFRYSKDIESEIAGGNKESFRWIVGLREGRICACHRTMLIAGWGFLGGVFVPPWETDIYLVAKITRFAVQDLFHVASQGLLAWTDTSETPKAANMRRLKFELYPWIVNRFFMDESQIEKFRGVLITRGDDRFRWRSGTADDYPQIVGLTEFNSSFIDALPLREADLLSRWYVCEEAHELQAAIHYWKHEDTVEIHFSLSRNPNFDIFQGIHDVVKNIAADARFVKINIEDSRKLTLLRLLSLGLNTYSQGHRIVLFRRKISEGHNENIPGITG